MALTAFTIGPSSSAETARPAFPDADALVAQAQALPTGPERDQRWRDAAAAYERAFSASPDGDQAAEAVFSAARAFKQIGDPQRGLELYARLLATYGAEARLAQLATRDRAKRVPADPRRLAERLKNLQQAFEILAASRSATFRYAEAAETFRQMATGPRFDEAWRRRAAYDAAVLYSMLDDDAKVKLVVRTFDTLHPTTDERARVEFLLVEHAYRSWDSNLPDDGRNRAARLEAERSAAQFYERNRHVPEAKRELAVAAYNVARAKRPAGDDSFRQWLSRIPPLVATMTPADGRLADMAAEAEYRLLDEELRVTWDGAPNRARYCGTMDAVFGKFGPQGQELSMGSFGQDTQAADGYARKLEALAHLHQESAWAAEGLARAGRVYEGLRAGLVNTTPDGQGACFALFSQAQMAILAQMQSQQLTPLQAAALGQPPPGAGGSLPARARASWETRKAKLRAGVEAPMVARYAQAASLGNAPATARLAYYTAILGDGVLRGYVTSTPDPNDPNKTLTYTTGMYENLHAGLHGLERGAPVPPPMATPTP